MSEERWKWIPGFEGLYQASTWGRIRSVDRWVIGRDGRRHFSKGHILQPKRNRGGYLRVDLWRNGKKHHFFVHRLVAMAWLNNPENKPQVNHRNEQKDMNFVENLSYCSAKENVTWGTGIKRRAASQSKPVEAIDPKTGQVVKEFASGIEAERNGFKHGAISQCCRGKRRRHRGFEWRFKES